VKDVKKGVRPLQAFFTKFSNDWVMNLAAALAYNLLTAIFPIFVAILAILGIVLGQLSQSSMTNLIDALQRALPPTLSHNKDLILTLTQQLKRASGPLGIIAVLLAIFGGSRLFVLMEGCFDIIYHLKPRKAIQQNIMAICMLLLFVILVPIMFVVSSLPAIVISVLNATILSHAPGIGFIFFLIGILGGVLVAFILFLSIYIVVPNQQISWRDSWMGALVAAVLLELFLSLFPFYVSHFMTGYVGQVGFAIILLAFFYYFAVILLLGVEVNAFFVEKIVATPADLVTMIHDWTSHAPKSPEETEKQAPPSHKPIKPQPDVTLDPLQQAQRLGQQAQQAQQTQQTGKQAVQTAQVYEEHQEDHRQQKEKGSLATSKVVTILEAVAGTALAFLVELVRLNRRKPGAS
jgi:YihY family inner membrane protein